MEVGRHYWWQKSKTERHQVEIASIIHGPLPAPSTLPTKLVKGEKVIVRALGGVHKGIYMLVDPALLTRVEN